MKRRLYDGYGITEMRRYATEYKIKGRSKMDGWALLAALHAFWRQRVVTAEEAVTSKVDVKPGVLLRHKTTGAVMRVTSELFPYLSEDGRGYESLCFTADYVSFGDKESSDPAVRRFSLDRENERDRTAGPGGRPIRHMLYQHEALEA